jgi:hypothetical protein
VQAAVAAAFRWKPSPGVQPVVGVESRFAPSQQEGSGSARNNRSTPWARRSVYKAVETVVGGRLFDGYEYIVLRRRRNRRRLTPAAPAVMTGPENDPRSSSNVEKRRAQTRAQALATGITADGRCPAMEKMANARLDGICFKINAAYTAQPVTSGGVSAGVRWHVRRWLKGRAAA